MVEDIQFWLILFFVSGIDTQILNNFLFHFAIDSLIFYQVKTVAFSSNKHSRCSAQGEY